jgi:hypothetical protein
MMQLSAFRQPLNGSDVASGNIGYRYLTGGSCLIINQHRTGTANALTATEFSAGQPQVSSQNPKKGSITDRLQGHWIIVKCK